MSRLKPRSRFIIPLLITILGVGIYQASNFEEAATPITESGERLPDAFAEGTVLKEFDEQGQLRLKITAQRSHYFRGEALIETRSPDIVYRNESGELLHLKASNGVYHIDSGQMTLEDDVRLSRDDQENPPVTIVTANLDIDTLNDFISTSSSVSIKQENNALSSIGLEASLNDRKLELQERVRGTYQLAN